MIEKTLLPCTTKMDKLVPTKTNTKIRNSKDEEEMEGHKSSSGRGSSGHGGYRSKRPVKQENCSEEIGKAPTFSGGKDCSILLMDEIFTVDEIELLKQSTHRRSSSKCFRCKNKRKQCSYEFPRCQNCVNAGVDCQAWAKGLQKPFPRSLPLYLEERVAQLEMELEELKKHRVINQAEEQSYSITKYSAIPFLESLDYSENDNTVDSFLFFHFNSSSLPAPFDTMIDGSKRGNMRTFLDNHPPVDLNSIPKNVIKIMMSNYVDFHLPQYPIISKPVLTNMINKITEKPEQATPFEKAVISITMAISAALITNRSEKRALSSSSALFATTISQILKTSWESKMKKLQMTLFIAHYAFANPYAANIWHTLRDALRLCVDMGLYKEVESEVITVLDVDDRRRLFFVCSGMLMHLSSVLRIKFPIKKSLISVEYPTIIDDSFITETGIDYTGPQTKAAALHFYTFRLCESEVCDVLWHNKEITCSLDEWIDTIEAKVEDWYVKAEEFAKVNQLRFRLICKASLQIRLRRRTPRIPKPTHASYIKLVNAISVHVDEYLKDAKSGQVSYLLMGVLYIVEAILNLLDVMWFESDWILEVFSLESLNSKLEGCMELLEKFSERWPDVKASNMIEYLKNITKYVIIKLDHSEEIDPKICTKISNQIEHLIFQHSGKTSPTPSPVVTSQNPMEIGENVKLLEYENLNDFVFLDHSNWKDHFIDNNFWNLQDLIGQMGDYI